MPLVNTVNILNRAKLNKICIGAFNIENIDMAKAIIESAEIMKTPVIIQTTFTTVNFLGAKVLSAMVSALAKESKAEIALHLDHGNSFEICKRCIDTKYSSVMIDGSHGDLLQNIEITKMVTDYAKSKGVSVEGEIGRVGGQEDELVSSISYTNVLECEEFVSKTLIDFVAIGVGTAHGLYEGEPKINIQKIKEIAKVVSIPLVLHGASGLSERVIKDCIAAGISKINFATELRQAYTMGIRSVLVDKSIYDPKAYQKEGREFVKKVVLNKMALLMS